MTQDPAEIQRQLNQEVERIRGYADLTEDAKRRRIAEVYEKARTAYEEAVEAQERAVQERVSKTALSVLLTLLPVCR